MTLYPGVALVTGAASGIGRACAVSFAREGCSRVAILDRNEDGLSETSRLCKAESGSVRTFIIPVDVRNVQDVNAAVEYVVEEWGRIDYAVNCAGIMGSKGPSHKLSPEDFDKVTAINYRGMWLSSRGEITQMLKQEPLPTHDGRPGNRGAIVNIGSNLALVSREDYPAYSASKAAIVSFTRSDAIDYSKHNIRVNSVCPGLIDTAMTTEVPKDDNYVMVAPLKRMGTPQEVADAALFLCSSKATFIQGTALSVDGGYVIN